MKIKISIISMILVAGTCLYANNSNKRKYNQCVGAIKFIINERDEALRQLAEQRSIADALLAKLNAIFPDEAFQDVDALVQKLSDLEESIKRAEDTANTLGTEQKKDGDTTSSSDIVDKVNKIAGQMKECNVLMNSLETAIADSLGADATDEEKQNLHERLQLLVDSYGGTLKEKGLLEDQLLSLTRLLAQKDADIKKITKKLKSTEEKRKELDYYFNLLVAFLNESNKDK